MKTFFPYLILILVIMIILVYNYSTNTGKLIEGLDNLSVSFCNKFEKDSSELEGACNRLTSKNCKESNCCVLVNGNKCSAGGITGPTFTLSKTSTL